MENPVSAPLPETPAAPEPKPESAPPTPTGDEFKPITSQDEFNRALNDRLTRERAKYQDYGDLKTKAAQFDAITEAQKTVLQKAEERADEAERRAQALETKQQIADWKTQIAKDAGVPASALRGNTEEDLKAHAEELKALLPDPNARKVGGAFVPTEGRNSGQGGSDPRTQFGQIIQNLRGKT